MLMNTSLITTILMVISITFSLFLGGLVLLRNPWRRTHRVFAMLSLNLALWAAGVLLIVHSHNEGTARFWIMATFAVACFLPATFYQFICVFPYQRFEGRAYVLAFLYLGALILATMVASPWYIVEIQIFPDNPPQVLYGQVFYAYTLLVAIGMVFAVANLVVKLRHTSGIQRRQVEHVLVGFLATTGFATLTNVLAPALKIGNLEVFGPCFVVLMMISVAYAIVRYHLLDIWFIVSRTTLYAFVTGVVIMVFLSTVSVVHWIFSSGGRVNDVLTTTLAALLIVLVIQPLKERAQLVLDRLILYRRYDARELIGRISREASQCYQVDILLRRVADDIAGTVGVQMVRILFVSEKIKGRFTPGYCTDGEERNGYDLDHDFLIDYVNAHPEPLVLEELLHARPTDQRVQLAKHLAEIDAYLLVPLKTTSGVVGVMALGEKTTRDIYVREDVAMFATLAGPLATAIENARLYCKLEELNLHLERIMSSMRGGVVAVDPAGTITTVNGDARDMLGPIKPGQSVNALEKNIAELLWRTLKEHRGISDVEILITSPDGERIPVAVSTSCLETQSREHLGAMVLMYNMTQIKRLESNVQRADRLSSIGTMAAGMAHEIKNPLQSIKTFTQLLPARFEDPDFRKTFFEVVPPEVQRIDSIVTRLLDFARPKPVHFSPLRLSVVVNDVLALVENQLMKNNILVTTDFPDDENLIVADEQQLHQVFLNLLLNAIYALKIAEHRSIHISQYYDRSHLRRQGQMTLFDVPCTRVVVSDTGSGIEPEHIDQLFTPFFTTKDDGCGLGLSVVHSIVTEHGGEIDVQSTPGVGTSFTVTFPLAGNAEMAERIGA